MSLEIALMVEGPEKLTSRDSMEAIARDVVARL